MNGRPPLLAARAAAKHFGSQLALAPTDFELAGGEAVALVGPNGAGKSTLLALLAGGEIYGLPGVFVALPFLAAARAVWEFFSDRIRFESWGKEGAEPIPVPVELETPPEPEAPTEIQRRSARR